MYVDREETPLKLRLLQTKHNTGILGHREILVFCSLLISEVRRNIEKHPTHMNLACPGLLEPRRLAEGIRCCHWENVEGCSSKIVKKGKSVARGYHCPYSCWYNKKGSD
jgi:hypothetical protein